MGATHFESSEEAMKGKRWLLVDASGQTVGRLASRIAAILRGKEKTTFTPHNDCGDFVVVVNADKVQFSGNKMEEKLYRTYSGYIGGVKEKSASEIFGQDPGQILLHAVRGMLPKTPLGRKQLMNVKIYAGGEHPHFAQQPLQVDVAR